MKIINFFVHAFSVLVYLTLGSLFLIMSLRIVDQEDVIASVHEAYHGFWSSAQTFILGVLFIFVGLVFAKVLVKKSTREDTLIYEGRLGRITVSLAAVEDIARKAVKKFLVIKDCKVKTYLEDTKLEVVLRLTLWSGHNIPEIIREVQEEVQQKLSRVIGMEFPFEIKAEVSKIEEPRAADGESMHSSEEAISS